MSFAADAVMDAIAPSPARPNARAPSDNTGPSFEEHLAAAAPPAEPLAKPTHGGAARENGAENKESTAGKSADAPEAPAVLPAPPHPAPQAAPIAPAFLAPKVSADAPEAPALPPTPQGAASAIPTVAPPITPPAIAGAEPAPAIEPAMAPNLPTAAAATAQAAPIAPPRAQSQQIAAQPANTATAQDTPTQPAQGQQLTPPPLVVPPTPTPSPQQNAAAGVAPPTAPAAPPVQDAKAAPAPMKTAPAATNLKAGATPAKGAANAIAAAAASKPDLSAFALSAPSAETELQAAASATPNLQSAAHAHQASAAEHGSARAAPMAAAQVSREIIRRFDGGNTRFEMRLDPPELGRIEVRLEVTRDHRVSAMIAADNPAALSDLVRHARELEQSLQAAGLELSEQGLSFDLRQREDEASNAGASDKAGGHNADAAENSGDQNTPLQTARLERWRGARIDVMA